MPRDAWLTRTNTAISLHGVPPSRQAASVRTTPWLSSAGSRNLISTTRSPSAFDGPQALLVALAVLRDDGLRRREDAARGAVVLLELDDPGALEVVLEPEDVAQRGAAPPVDALVGVADDREVGARGRRGVFRRSNWIPLVSWYSSTSTWRQRARASSATAGTSRAAAAPRGGGRRSRRARRGDEALAVRRRDARRCVEEARRRRTTRARGRPRRSSGARSPPRTPGGRCAVVSTEVVEEVAQEARLVLGVEDREVARAADAVREAPQQQTRRSSGRCPP